ncbi:hypothetical protein GCM10007425_08190 [Lysinibacillus alkalisoli]|uniref:Uncharacterized protein n=1 Tax=Lysinibacillus alkalisoli TaxID=1911548 RepID=A0A917LEV9_9BACI|nr:hypothetical protein [Lysinibacillus alkalisoli]GGG16198.1 hypothetical protein GCM10007425_08190 [Lysinibacillus alkalisoli]
MNRPIPTWATAMMAIIGILMILSYLPLIFPILAIIGVVILIKYIIQKSKNAIEETKTQFDTFTSDRDVINRLPAYKEFSYVEKRLMDKDSKYAKQVRHAVFETEQDGFSKYKNDSKRIRSYIKEGDISRDFYLIFDKNMTMLDEMAKELKTMNLDDTPSPIVEAKVRVMWRELRIMHDELMQAMEKHVILIKEDYLGAAREEREALGKLMAEREAEREDFEKSLQ